MTGQAIQVGDDVWWHGMRMVVTKVAGGKVRHQNKTAMIDVRGTSRPPFMCASLESDLKWDDELNHWAIPGAEGTLPRYRPDAEGKAVLVDPPTPTCKKCGMITWRKGPVCTNCRLKVRVKLKGVK